MEEIYILVQRKSRVHIGMGGSMFSTRRRVILQEGSEPKGGERCGERRPIWGVSWEREGKVKMSDDGNKWEFAHEKPRT